MRLWDSHFHLEEKDDPVVVLESARQAGVERATLIGCDLASSRRAAATAQAHADMLLFSAGVHPHDVKGFDGDLEPFARLWEQPLCGAVGEIGLDFHYEKDPAALSRQAAVFEQFLDAAVRYQLVPVIHSRDAFAETLMSLRSVLRGRHPFILHCYTGGPEWVEPLLELGATISFSGIVSFPKSVELRAAAALVPARRLLVETDAPYLAPLPWRGRRNCPAYVGHVLEALAAARGEEPAALAEQTFANAAAIFARGAKTVAG